MFIAIGVLVCFLTVSFLREEFSVDFLALYFWEASCSPVRRWCSGDATTDVQV